LPPTFFYETLSHRARAVDRSTSLDQANDALHAIGISTELDFERSLEKSRAGR
jgi:hypothetical protein